MDIENGYYNLDEDSDIQVFQSGSFTLIILENSTKISLIFGLINSDGKSIKNRYLG